MRWAYRCEACALTVAPATTRAELAWLRDRAHIAREVARHSSNGLDSWMMDGLAFIDDHGEHGIEIICADHLAFEANVGAR